tara:strand:- start:5269 stop:5595 length:327 start_codon:yes stop_codon:yes gene_type:complete
MTENKWIPVSTPPTIDDADPTEYVMTSNEHGLGLSLWNDMWEEATHWMPYTPPETEPTPIKATTDEEFQAMINAAKMKLTNLLEHAPEVIQQTKAWWQKQVEEGRGSK